MTGIVWTGVVNFTDSSDVGTTGVATLTLTPDVGVSNLPLLAAGNSGPPPTLRNVTVNQVAYGVTPPGSSWTLVTAGSAGVPSVYDLTMYVNSGQQGVPGSFAIASATDLTGTAVNKYTMTYSTSDNKWHITPMLAGDIFALTPVTGFSAYSGNAPSAILGHLTVTAQPFDWRPSVTGGAVATGTANTRIDLFAYLNSPTTGDQVGYARGIQAAAPPPLALRRAFGAALTGTYAKVAAGVAGELYFVAKQVNGGTTDAWAAAAADMDFSVKVNAIP